MEPRISIITLGVSDLGRSARFYRDGLGFPEHEAGGDEITFLALTGQLLGLYPRDALADDIGRADQKGTPQPALHGFTIAHNVATRAEVDSVLRQAATAGASLAPSPAHTPDTHSWSARWWAAATGSAGHRSRPWRRWRLRCCASGPARVPGPRSGS